MIKKSILSLMLMATIGYVSAQSLQFELNGEVFADGQTIYCNDFNPDFFEYAQEMQIRNISNDEQKVVVEREILSLPENSMTYFCWGLCFGPDVNVSTEPQAMAPGEVSLPGMLGFHFMPNDPESDVAIVKYYAYDERHADERISIIIAYNTAEGVNELPVSMSSAYPNPATSTVHFDYALEGNATAVVYNIVGQEVMRKDLNATDGQLSLSVADLQNGIYFCTLTVNGRAQATQKFVVKK